MHQHLLLATTTSGLTGQTLLLIAPLVLLWLALTITALVDLIRRRAVRGSKLIWGIVIICISTLGPIAYFIFGRKEV